MVQTDLKLSAVPVLAVFSALDTCAGKVGIVGLSSKLL
jgi:hypothetical protein